MRIVVALGGNALVRNGDTSIAGQRAAIARVCGPLARIAREHELVITHGNGPQIGLLADAARRSDLDCPLDVVSAMTAGMLGYLLQQELGNRLAGVRAVATLLTRTLVSGEDAAFGMPVKPIGVPGRQRLVPSPEPLKIIDVEPIRWVLQQGGVPVCAGGGGIPVVLGKDGVLHGVEAVVDKDSASAELACDLHADRLVMATDVTHVVDGWGTAAAREIAAASPDSLDASQFEPGSMRPKVAAAIRFANDRSGLSVIGSIDQLAELVDGTSGTKVSGDVQGVVHLQHPESGGT